MSEKNSHTSNTLKQPLSLFIDINDNLDREELVQKLSVSAQAPETFDLLCPKAFENLIFKFDPKWAKCFHSESGES